MDCPQCGYPAPCGRCDYDEQRWDAILSAPRPPLRGPDCYCLHPRRQHGTGGCRARGCGCCAYRPDVEARR